MSFEVTPLMAQYFAIKEEHPHALLFFQVGDFYELFFDDARTVSQLLALTLTKRGKHQGEDIPLCGVPVHALAHHVTKLVKAGYSVAICDQTSKPVPGQVVKRAVSKVLTPGTLIEAGLLDEKSPSFLLSFAQNERSLALIFAELGTGQLFVTQCPATDDRAVEAELSKFLPDEIVCKNENFDHSKSLFKRAGYNVTSIDERVFSEACSNSWVVASFDEQSAQRFLKEQVLYEALDTLVRYLNKNNAAAFALLNQVHFYRAHDYLLLDAQTQKNLDLIVNSHHGGREHTLLSVLDRAQTSMGSRLLKKWIVRPLISKSAILERQRVVGIFAKNIGLMNTTQQLLAGMPDLERIVARVAMDRATKQDYLGIKRFLEIGPALVAELAKHTISAELLGALVGQLYVNRPLFEYLDAALSEELGAQQLIKKGFDLELDELRSVAENSNNDILDLERREVERTGITSLKIRYTDVFGYGIEITKANYGQVPPEFIPQQTLANRTRYSTAELKELEMAIVDARKREGDVEQLVYQRVCKEIAQHITALRSSAQALATLDVLIGFATCAFESRYSCPEINESGVFDIVDGRHPVVEHVLHATFIPNSTRFSDSSLMHIITGPNMGGKSTYLRQISLIAILAHLGSFVPAKRANISLLDRIFTRIGSGDDLAGGKSTFWVEMEETAVICAQATDKSLVILDEVGRGTSTYDGMALAHAIVCYLVEVVKCKGLFATHYHELSALDQEFPSIKNYSTACKSTAHTMLFLHKIIEGPALGSFGIQIAKQAGLPEKIIHDAQAFLERKPQHAPQVAPGYAPEKVFELATSLAKERACYEFLKDVEVDDLSPRQALDVLFKLKQDFLA